MGIVGKSFGNSVWEERRTFIVSPRNRAFKTGYVAISPGVSPHMVAWLHLRAGGGKTNHIKA